jgi:hypothetical protein
MYNVTQEKYAGEHPFRVTQNAQSGDVYNTIFADIPHRFHGIGVIGEDAETSLFFLFHDALPYSSL